MTKKTMKSERISDEDFLERMFRKSESKGTQRVALTSLKMFELFCQNQGVSKAKMIQRYQDWFDQSKTDIRSICISLDKFVQFLNKDHDKIILQTNFNSQAFKRKSPKTIRLYLGFIKSYLRIAHAVKIGTEDIADYIQFPKPRKEPRRPVTLEQLKQIMNNASPKRKALYYVLISSGMRLGEALTLTTQNFHLKENPVRVRLEAENTKTKEGRETYISSEAVEKLRPIIENLKDHERIFTKIKRVDYAVSHEDRIFMNLREKLGMTEKYSNSNRYVVNLHAFRAYFHTKASQKHGDDYANALDGHGAYLKQYYRLDTKDRAVKYLELESSLLIESVMVETRKTKDKEIQNLQEVVQKLQDKMLRMELLTQ